MKKKIINYIFMVIGIIGLWLFLDHILNFNFTTYFYKKNPNITKYIGTNVVSRWADFSFFTYHTLILFSVWCLLFGLSNLTKNKRINNFLTNPLVLAFVTTNYIITVFIYTIFEITSGSNFGLYATNWRGIHNLGTNLIIHYVYFVLCLIVFLKIKSNNSGDNLVSTANDLPQKKFKVDKSSLFAGLYLFFYFIIVKLLGEFAYQIKWFPYPIFDASTFGSSLGVNNYAISLVLLIIINLIIFFSYILLFNFLKKYKAKIKNI